MTSAYIIGVISTVLSGTFALLGVLLSNKNSERRDRIALDRQLRRDQVQQTRTLYEDALVILDKMIIEAGRGTDADQNRVLAVQARLGLWAPTEVYDQFLRTWETLEQWASQARKGQPTPLGGGMVMMSSGQEKEREAAAALFPNLRSEQTKLQAAMRSHLAALQSPANLFRKVA